MSGHAFFKICAKGVIITAIKLRGSEDWKKFTDNKINDLLK